MFETEVFNVTHSHTHTHKWQGRFHSAFYQCIGPPEIKSQGVTWMKSLFPDVCHLCMKSLLCVKCYVERAVSFEYQPNQNYGSTDDIPTPTILSGKPGGHHYY